MKNIPFIKLTLILSFLIVEIYICLLFGFGVYYKIKHIQGWLFKFANISNIYKWSLAWIGYIIPFAEAGVSIGILFERSKKYSAFLALTLLGIYEFFLIYQLYSPYGNPCSCQGIFPFMDLTKHLLLTSISFGLILIYLLKYKFNTNYNLHKINYD